MERIDAQPVRAPRSSLALLTAAPSITAGGDRWLDGFKWQPELIAAADAIGVACGAFDGSVDGDAADQPAGESFTPFVVWAIEKCSTKERQRDRFGRALRALEAEQSYLAARELWDGEAARAAGATNRHLADEHATVLTSGAVSATVALTMVDSALTRRLRNRLGLVFCRPELVDIWSAAELVWRDASGAVLTPNGHRVIADAGSTGSGPRPTAGDDVTAADGSSQWVYGTDLIYTRLSGADTLPPTDENAADAIVRTTNDQLVIAHRVVGFQWDHHAQLAVQVAQGALL